LTDNRILFFDIFFSLLLVSVQAVITSFEFSQRLLSTIVGNKLLCFFRSISNELVFERVRLILVLLILIIDPFIVFDKGDFILESFADLFSWIKLSNSIFSLCSNSSLVVLTIFELNDVSLSKAACADVARIMEEVEFSISSNGRMTSLGLLVLVSF